MLGAYLDSGVVKRNDAGFQRPWRTILHCMRMRSGSSVKEMSGEGSSEGWPGRGGWIRAWVGTGGVVVGKKANMFL